MVSQIQLEKLINDAQELIDELKSKSTESTPIVNEMISWNMGKIAAYSEILNLL